MEIAGIGGGTGSGKTTFAAELMRRLGERSAVVIPHDAYYRDLSHLAPSERATVNFDHPDSLETELLVSHLRELSSGRAVNRPEYDFASHTRRDSGTVVRPTGVVIVEGILVFADARLREMFTVSVYVDTPDDVRLARRIQRDVTQRGRTVASVVRQWTDTARPMHACFVAPGKKFADFIVSGEGSMETGVGLIAGAMGSGRQ